MDKKIKCVVWDLDNTLWKGILSEGDEIVINDNVLDVIKGLDNRGILQSISSKNDFDAAFSKLKELKIDEYFIYPQINWNPKSNGLKNIAKSINIGIDTLAFVDDQEFEREEVNFNIPEILCIDAKNINKILDMPEMNPIHLTEDSKNRRKLYQNDIVRNKIQEEFEGTEEEFLRSLGMKFSINKVQNDDLTRAEELTVRTHQLNATGYTYSYEELEQFSKDDGYDVLIAGLEDKYGDYGKIGLVLIEKGDKVWNLKLLLMSCRVMSRGVGSVLLNYIVRKANKVGVTLRAEFVPTDRNRVMYITYKFGGFKEVEKSDDMIIFEATYDRISPLPDYVEIIEGLSLV